MTTLELLDATEADSLTPAQRNDLAALLDILGELIDRHGFDVEHVPGVQWAKLVGPGRPSAREGDQR